MAVNWYFSPFKLRVLAKLRDKIEKILPYPKLLHSSHITKLSFQDWAAFERAGASTRAGSASKTARVWCGFNALFIEAAVAAVTVAAALNEDIALGIMDASMRVFGDSSSSVFLCTQSANGEGRLELGG